MINPFRILTTLCILILLASALNGAGIELTGIGARATAMGGVYRAVADDWSAMYWNPAGLAFSERINAGISLNFVMPRASFRFGDSHYYNLHGGEPFRPFSVADRATHDAMPLNFLAPSAGITYNTGKWSFGLGFWAPLALGTRWDLFSSPNIDAYNSRYPQYEYENNILVLDIHPTVAYRVNDKLAIGAGLSVLVAEFGIRQPAFLQNPYLYDSDLRQLLQTLTPADQSELPAQMGNTPFDHLINDVELRSSGDGWGMNAGVLFKPMPNWRIGAAVQLFSSLDLAGDYHQISYFADAPAFQRLSQFYSDTLYSKLHAGKLISDQQFLLLSKFYSGEVLPLVDTQAHLELPLPKKFALGVSYAGFRNLLIAVDASYTQWSVWDVIRINDRAGEELSQLALNWRDAVKVGVGAEYRLGRVTLRGGFASENRAAPDESVSPSIPDINRRFNLNFGVCVPLGPVEFSVVYERLLIADRRITDWSYDEMTLAQNVAGDYTLKINSIMAGFDFRL